MLILTVKRLENGKHELGIAQRDAVSFGLVLLALHVGLDLRVENALIVFRPVVSHVVGVKGKAAIGRGVVAAELEVFVPVRRAQLCAGHRRCVRVREIQRLHSQRAVLEFHDLNLLHVVAEGARAVEIDRLGHLVQRAEILGGKIASGFILASLSTILVAAVSCIVKTSFFSLIVLICLGSLIFAISGIVLGAFVKSQSACGALNSLIYLVLIMPVTMADYNALMQKIAYFLPTWYLYDGFCKLIFASGTWADIMPNVAYLFIELTIFAAIGIVAIKKVRLTV